MRKPRALPPHLATALDRAPVRTEQCPVCRTVHALPLCPQPPDRLVLSNGRLVEVVVVHVCPPVPTREWDWLAYEKGQEEGAIGEGATAEAAKSALLIELESWL